jgi:cellulose synthase (UDP-forming)
MSFELTLIPILILAGAFFAATPWLSPESPRVRKAAFLIFSAFQLEYLLWRVTSTLPPREPFGPFAYSVCYLLIELILASVSYRFLRSLHQTHDRRAEADRHQRWYGDRPPMVDVLIPTYNEAWPIVEKTLVGALSQDHLRRRVWLLDDGRRPEFRVRAQALGARYLTRSGNAFAKAGNLNAGLEHVLAEAEASEFISVLDADFVPRRNFLTRCLALMHDPEVGLVQTPQYHFNADLFQATFHAWRGWPDTQRFTFNTILPARDAAGRAYCCGTSFVARSVGIRTIGGFPTESVTEDVLTSMKLSTRGWRTVYLRELLTTGLSPEGVHEYLTQRGRWCLGGIQIGLWLWKGSAGKPFAERFWALESFVRWGYTSLLRAVILVVAPIYWFTGISPFATNSRAVVCWAFPLIFLQRWYTSWLSRGGQLPFVNQAQTLLASFAVIPALFKGLLNPGDHRFAVTDKGVRRAGLLIHWRTLRWLLGYAGVVIAGIIYHFCLKTGGSYNVRFVTLMWSLFNLLVVFIAAAPCLEAPRPREEERFPTRESVELDTPNGPRSARLRDLSLSGALLELNHELAPGDTLGLQLADVGAVRARVVRRAAPNVWGIAFGCTDDERHALIRKLFCSDRYIHPPDEGDGGVAFASILRKLFA